MECVKRNKELYEMCCQRRAKERDPVERFKYQALKGGCCGIKTIAKKFRIMDDNWDRKLSWEKFQVGCAECRIVDKAMTTADLKQVFARFDRNGDKFLDFDEFLPAVRPWMNDTRKKLVRMAFAKMDKTGTKVITWKDVIENYDVRLHPKFLNGEMNEKQVCDEFRKSFDVDAHEDGKITMDEWMDYFSGVSASIDEDAYFNLMMRNSWGVCLLG